MVTAFDSECAYITPIAIITIVEYRQGAYAYVSCVAHTRFHDPLINLYVSPRRTMVDMHEVVRTVRENRQSVERLISHRLWRHESSRSIRRHRYEDRRVPAGACSGGDDVPVCRHRCLRAVDVARVAYVRTNVCYSCNSLMH